MVTIVLPAKPGKRYRPPSIDDSTGEEKRDEPTSKFTKLKSGFALFSKFANSFSFHNNTENPWPDPTQQQQQQQQGHKRRSSIGTFFQSLCNTRSEQGDADALSKRRGSTQSFANDAIFERYRYRKQFLSQTKLDLGHKKQAPEGEEDGDCVERNALTAPGCSAPLPRVICWQDPLPGILVNKNNNHNTSSGHRHTSSAVSVPTNVGHRRNKTIVHIRHYSHVSYISSSNITVNSEDLTAKEFADIAGIKILPDDESSPKCSSCDEAMLLAESRRESTCSHADASSSGLSLNCGHNNNTNTPQIWDTAFWRDPVDTGIKQHLPSTSDTSILQTLRPESNEQLNQPTVIKRGRFEIHLGSS